MSDPSWLTDEQMERLQPFFPKSHRRPWVDGWRVLSGIVFVHRNGLRRRDAAEGYGPAKALANCWKRWGEADVIVRMLEGRAADSADPRTVMIDETSLKPYHTASSSAVENGGGLDG